MTGGTRPRRSRRSPSSTSSASSRSSRPRKTRSWPSDGGARSLSHAAARRRHHGRQRPLGAATRHLAPPRTPGRQGLGPGRRRDEPPARHPVSLAVRLLERELGPPPPGGPPPDVAAPSLPRDGAREDDAAPDPAARGRKPAPPASRRAR